MPARDLAVSQIQITFDQFKSNFIRVCTALDQLAEWCDQHFDLDVPEKYHELYHQLEAINPLINPSNPDANGHTYPVVPFYVADASNETVPAPEEAQLDNGMEIDDANSSPKVTYESSKAEAEVEAKICQTAMNSTHADRSSILFDLLRDSVKIPNPCSQQTSHNLSANGLIDYILETMVDHEVSPDKYPSTPNHSDTETLGPLAIQIRSDSNIDESIGPNGATIDDLHNKTFRGTPLRRAEEPNDFDASENILHSTQIEPTIPIAGIDPSNRSENENAVIVDEPENANPGSVFEAENAGEDQIMADESSVHPMQTNKRVLRKRSNESLNKTATYSYRKNSR